MEKQALREAQKAPDRLGADHFRKLELARLKIQTMEPWKRLLLALPALAHWLFRHHTRKNGTCAPLAKP